MTQFEPEMLKSLPKSAFPKLTQPNGLGTGPIPIEPYISQKWFELERDRVFGRAWQPSAPPFQTTAIRSRVP